MLNDLNMWNKIGRIVMRLSERLEVDTERALDIFYSSKTCRNLHDPEMGLYLLADNCIVEDILAEIRE
ncbi:MAG: DUF3791 domain-containing protein [Bacteroidales bacterium]|nr:DUF3791 domain-containing protein [Bacteroidales bacterium]